MKIIAFGSCLSRFVANHYIKIFGGKLVSCVYHNRSDAFVKRFITEEWSAIDIEKIFKNLEQDISLVDEDNKAINILNNQTVEKLGKHRLSKGTNVLTALNEDIDLIIVDNYMDLSARLAFHKSEDENGIFINLGNLKGKFVNSYYSDDYMTPQSAVQHMSTIIKYFQIHAKNAQVVFINFPYNTYSDKNRVERAKEYEQLSIDAFDCHVIKALNVHQSYQTKDKQHFKPPQYAAYAGIINNLVSDNNVF
ncbi:hypothetical protein [Psychrobacter celer]|uniref:hypothetical protein n=1 Tax=Psychrobacter celer TaxID=306572 RepID=UPI0018DF3C08|nr:hypothetical protein [Psychrobacter celer]